MNNVKFISKDQNSQDETTNYWFELNGESYAVSESGPDVRLLDCDGCPFNMSDYEPREILEQLFVTDEMRSDY